MENETFHVADYNKLIKRHNKKEAEEKKENSENEILDEAIRHNVIDFRECNIGNGGAQRNTKVNNVENELIKIKGLVQHLIIDSERVCENMINCRIREFTLK